MNSSRIELALVFENLGIPKDNLTTFSKRFRVQKRIYLAQIAGADLGYRYGWYIHGPYSTGLTSDAFTLKQEIDDGDTEFDEYRLHPDVTKRLETAKELCQKPGRFGGTTDEWLELLASLHFLRHIAYRPAGKTMDFETVFAELIESKPKFTNRESDARLAWSQLDDFGLIGAKTLA
jgi:hypothetical protein